MTKAISFLLSLILCFSLFTTSAFAATIYDGGKDDLDRWTISFSFSGEYDVEQIPETLNEYCIDHNCEVIDISMTASNRVIIVAAIMEKK